MIRTTNMSSGKLRLNEPKYVTKEFHQRNAKSQLKKGDLLIARHGDGGTPCLFDLNVEANCLNVVIVKADYNKAYPMFLKVIMDSNIVAKQISDATVGSVQNVVNTKAINELIFVVPSLNEQKEIIDILTEVEYSIETHEDKKNKLQQLKKGLMQQLLTGKTRVKVD